MNDGHCNNIVGQQQHNIAILVAATGCNLKVNNLYYSMYNITCLYIVVNWCMYLQYQTWKGWDCLTNKKYWASLSKFEHTLLFSIELFCSHSTRSYYRHVTDMTLPLKHCILDWFNAHHVNFASQCINKTGAYVAFVIVVSYDIDSNRNDANRRKWMNVKPWI